LRAAAAASSSKSPLRRRQLHGILDADDVKPEVELPSTYAMHPDLFLDSCSS
jgi:hypothetical protein